LFRTFKHTAYRLEVRDGYNEPSEAEPLRKFLVGEHDDRLWFQGWLAMIRAATSQGRRFARVRVVTVPLTDYSRFGLSYAQYTVEAGEDIRYLSRGKAMELDLPNYDYWLFDSSLLVRMRFGDSDVYLGSEVVDESAEIVQHNVWRDVAWHHAVPRADFAKEQG
jgi:hypothetical protein